MMPSFVSQVSGGSNLTNSTANVWPDGVEEGDLLILAVETANQPPTVSTTGWTTGGLSSAAQAVGTPGDFGATSLNLWRAYYTPSLAFPVMVGAADHKHWNMSAWRGVNQSSPLVGTTVGSSNAATVTAVTTPALFLSGSADTLVVDFVAHGLDAASSVAVGGWSSPNLVNYTEVFDNTTSLGNGGGIAAATGEFHDTGSVQAGTATLAGSSPYCAIKLGLRGAANIAFSPALFRFNF